MRMVVGLGNPGKKYQKTKHNIGFLCVDMFAAKHKLTYSHDKKFEAEVIKHQDYILVKPQTFMNLSGKSVQAVSAYFNIAPEDILIIHDDLDLPLGKLRLRYQGSAGGHNGLKSIISSIDSQLFNRVRFGIGKENDLETRDYVLSKFHKKEEDIVFPSMQKTVDIIEDFVNGADFNAIMNTYN